MYMNNPGSPGIAALLLCLFLTPPLASAKVNNAKADQLGVELTPMGAELNGNPEGSIPPWSGNMDGLPTGLNWTGPGSPYPDPYGDDEILFTITAANMGLYTEKLSAGQQALFRNYPDSFQMHVYPSHRDGRYPSRYLERVKFNARHAQLINDDDGIVGYTGGVAFPIPQSGAEAIWNGRTNHIDYTYTGTFDDLAVFANGNRSHRRAHLTAENPYANPDNPVGMEQDEIGIYHGFGLQQVIEPARSKGTITAAHEPLDYVTHARAAWIYMPGQRRVRRAPTVGYDTPEGPGGLVTIDDIRGFNGAMDRYQWKLLGKREIYIPYHNYKFDDPDVSYTELLLQGHINPEYMRYELHRVWVVEATLRKNKRHVYARRLIYLDEDSWNFVITENYDSLGELWKVAFINSFYEFGSKGYVTRANIFHDLRAGAYIALYLVNESEQFRWNDTPARGINWYSPASMRKLGRR